MVRRFKRCWNAGSASEDAGWVAAALGLSLLSWLLARRMIERSGLL
jgi:uncharacterized protein (TIGR03382 family)